MQNYQKLYYQNYFAENQNGEYIPVTRRECFAPGAPTTSCNPYPQRWFYDPESGYAIRPARNKEGDTHGKRNAADLKSEERYQKKKSQCVWKNTKKCDQNCETCNRKHKSRTVGLDKTWVNEDGDTESHFKFADESTNLDVIMEDSELLNTLFSVLDRLSADDRELWHCLVNKIKKRDIADRFNLTLDGVYCREKRLKSTLRLDETLKSFYEGF